MLTKINQMKTFKLVLLIAIVLTSCNEPKKITEVEKTAIKSKVDSLLTKWHQAAAAADFDVYFRDVDIVSVIVGTDASEYWTKKEFEEFCKPNFEDGKGWDFKTLKRNIFVSRTADFVWFDELLDTWMGPCRGSGVLEKTANEWRIKQYIFSVTVPNEDIHDVIHIKSENDSIFLHNFKSESK